jgi:sulfatase maturation enzyme AslB (radical SAM superfamily)
MTTNALAITEERMEFIKANNISLHFSFDGVKECQDYNRPLRGSDLSSFDIAVTKIPMILNYRSHTTMRMTIHNETVQYYSDNFKFGYENGFKSMFAAINTYDN